MTAWVEERTECCQEEKAEDHEEHNVERIERNSSNGNGKRPREKRCVREPRDNAQQGVYKRIAAKYLGVEE